MFVLKSASPRRKQILSDLGFLFLIQPEHIDESQYVNEEPLQYLERMVHSKLGTQFEPNNLYLACDTIVVYENEILHKPEDELDAFRILKILSGKEHSVFSGAVLQHGSRSDFFFEETFIQFKDWKEAEIETYIKEYKPFDKAGSYGIQDKNGPVKMWKGSYLNVLGFPFRSFLAHHELWIHSWEDGFKRIG
ncbi:Maf-like protein [Leptospira levettii]|uniref:Maf family protein n=1 Tax=Leptospira levettii TaxID=2023178 RepID=UPI001082937C|nr:Maf family protein [Leptospira levettii]TGL17302.1 Maf-like protein [Leptospira levettii]